MDLTEGSLLRCGMWNKWVFSLLSFPSMCEPAASVTSFETCSDFDFGAQTTYLLCPGPETCFVAFVCSGRERLLFAW